MHNFANSQLAKLSLNNTLEKKNLLKYQAWKCVKNRPSWCDVQLGTGKYRSARVNQRPKQRTSKLFIANVHTRYCGLLHGQHVEK